MSKVADGWWSRASELILAANADVEPYAADGVDVVSGAADWTDKGSATQIVAGGTIGGAYIIMGAYVSSIIAAGTCRVGEYQLKISAGALGLSTIFNFPFAVHTAGELNQFLPTMTAQYIGGRAIGIDPSGDINAYLLYGDAAGSGASTVRVKILYKWIDELGY